jgi:hypothetical protein
MSQPLPTPTRTPPSTCGAKALLVPLPDSEVTTPTVSGAKKPRTLPSGTTLAVCIEVSEAQPVPSASAAAREARTRTERSGRWVGKGDSSRRRGALQGLSARLRRSPSLGPLRARVCTRHSAAGPGKP